LYLKNKPKVDLFDIVEFSKNQLEAIFDHLDPMCLVNNEYEIMRLNRAMAEFIGKGFRECIKQPLQEIFPDWDHKLFTNNINLALFSGRPVNIHDYPLVDKGKKGWFEITFYPVLSEEKTSKECVIYIKNVTELYLTKKILLEQYKRLEEQQLIVENRNTLLIETQKSLDEAYQALMEDLTVAQEVQQGTLPTVLPRIPGIEFFSSYDPIRKVGGDIYDILELGDNRIGIFMGDVSGHGLAPAFVGAMVKMALVDHAYQQESPKKLFTIMNNNLVRHLKSGHYLTAFYGILDLSNNMFLYCKASHPNPILIRQDGDVQELETSGMFLGLIEEPDYEEKSIQLKNGDRLYFFTDGYFEAKGKDGTQITYSGLKKMIQSVNHMSPKKAHGSLIKKLGLQTGEEEQEDDRTFLMMEITGNFQERYSSMLDYFANDKNIIFRCFSTEKEFYEVFRELEAYLARRVSVEDDRRKINICTLELANNALEHGNKKDPSKIVYIAYSASPETVTIALQDEGQGFDYSDMEDPRKGDNWRKERGRGIFIVRSYMDKVYFNPKGNLVTIIKHLKDKG
jgi:sigma-B regulation protein RsbU (phosphoserine phosphatase)